jgi:hypothetical protein
MGWMGEAILLARQAEPDAKVKKAAWHSILRGAANLPSPGFRCSQNRFGFFLHPHFIVVSSLRSQPAASTPGSAFFGRHGFYMSCR